MNNETSIPDVKSVWERAKQIYLSTLRTEEERSQAEAYFAMVVSTGVANGVFEVKTSNKMAAEFLEDKYADKLKMALVLAGVDASIELKFVFDPASQTAITAPRQPMFETRSAAQKQAPYISTLPLEENYTFEEFVQGPSNSWAFAAARGVTNNPGNKSTNPLFIHGGTGLGKTHLMQAIGNELRKKNPSMSVCYITAETFLNEYINALQQKGMESFRERYRFIDVLLVDDIQFLQKGKQCQEEFFNTFNYLTTNHKQIVMTSDVAPKNLPALEERLISRFEGGMVQEIEAPAIETRLAILKKKAENLTPSIPNHALNFIAEHIKSHVRAMEGALAKVHVTYSLNPAQPLTDEMLAFILKDFISKEQSLKKLNAKEIQECVAKKFSITLQQILSTDRSASLVTPRQLAMYICRKYTTKSLLEIAKEFDKSHATILHGVKAIEKRLDVEDDLRNILESVLSEFGYKLSDKMD